jgi:tetratricopeptide (TPR) repeat protein
MAKRLPYLFVGWLWYLIIIFPVIGIIQITTSTPYSMADRYHYLPSIGISIMLAWGIPSLFRSEKTKQRILFPVAFFALGILVYLTGQQCSYWKNSVDLWNHALKVTKNNVTANCRLADAYADIGQYERSIETFKIVIQLIPDYIIGYNRLGIAYSNVRQYKLAIENFNEAIRMKPDYVDAYANRSIVYFTQGNIDSGCNDARKACALGECKLLELAKGQGYCR